MNQEKKIMIFFSKGDYFNIYSYLKHQKLKKQLYH
jgi:hypothetical protein